MAELNLQVLIDLIDRYNDGELDEASLRQLEEMLLQSEKAREYFVYMASVHRCWREWAQFETMLNHASLYGSDAKEIALDRKDGIDPLLASIKGFGSLAGSRWKAGRQHGRENLHDPAQGTLRSRSTTFGGFVPLAAAALLLAAALVAIIAVVATNSSGNAPGTGEMAGNPQANPTGQAPADLPRLVARVDSGRDARWAKAPSGGQFERGDQAELLSGLARIIFEDGAEVLVQAPAKLELTGTNRMRLVKGGISATIPESAHGFEVQTPQMKVIDLGTEFSVMVDGSTDSGATDVYVHQGEVQVQHTGADASAKPVLLQANEGARAASSSNTLDLSPGINQAQAACLRALDDQSFRPTILRGDVVWLESPSITVFDRRRAQDGDLPLAYCFLESVGQTPGDPFSIARTFPLNDEGLIPVDASGSTSGALASYLVVFHYQGKENRFEDIDLAIHFPGEIAGFTVENADLIASSPAFGRAGLQYPDVLDALDAAISNQKADPTRGDRVSVRPDGQTLDLHLRIYDGADLIRVFIKKPAVAGDHSFGTGVQK